MLVLSLRRGESFYVGDQRVRLVDFDADRARLRTRGRTFDCSGELVDLPGAAGVRVSAGRRAERAVRIGIEAPSSVKVLRERLYRADRAAERPPARGPRRYHLRAMSCRTCVGTMTCHQDGVEVPCPAAQDPGLPVCDPGR